MNEADHPAVSTPPAKTELLCPCDLSGLCAHPYNCHCDPETRGACNRRLAGLISGAEPLA